MKGENGAGLVLLSAVFFSLGGLFFKLVSWDGLAINSARSLLAGLFILAVMLKQKHALKVNAAVVGAAAAIAVTNTLYAAANKLTTAGNVIVLEFTMPVFVILIMFLVYRKKPSGLEILTCMLVLGGIICFFVDSLSAGNMLGNALALLAGFLYAIFFILNSREDSEPYTAILIAYVISFVIGLPSLLKTDVVHTPVSMLAAVAALGFIQQGLGHLCFSAGITKTNAVAASLISGLEPVLNPILTAVFYHEMVTPLSLIGALIVLGSIITYNVVTSAGGKK